jgi:hypothetical protein
MRPAALAVFAAAALVLSGCGGGTLHMPAGRDSRAPAVPQLRNLDQLRAAFNAHSGEPRLVVLIAPT